MNKCRLCQQLNNYLTIIYNDRTKSLAEIILKLKGFKDPLDINQPLTICDNCKQGIESVATFWENIPEANTANRIKTDKLLELKERKPVVLSKGELCGAPKEYEHVSTKTVTELKHEHVTSHASVKREPIKLRIKLPRKLICKDKSLCITDASEPAQKRMRRYPKHYENYVLNSSRKALPNTAATTVQHNILNEPQVAVLRSNNGQDIGKLIEVDSKGKSSKMRIVCEICSQVFRFENGFQKHLKTHEEEKDFKKNYLFYCKLCDKSFTAHYLVRKHFRLVHSEERPLKCQYCEASFKYNFNLSYHMAKHVAKKRFECVFCKKMFLMRYELKIHLRTHTKEKPYKCEFCSFAFAHRSNLKAHQKIKHLRSSVNLTTSKDSINIEEKLKTNIFKPPQNLIENEVIMQPDLNDKNVYFKNSPNPTTFQDSTNIEEKLLNNIFKPSNNLFENEIQTDYNHENLFNSKNSANLTTHKDPINIEEKINQNSSQILLENEIEMQSHLNKQNVSPPNFEDFTRDFEHDKLKNSPRAKLFSESIARPDVIRTSSDNKILKFSEANETSRESLKIPAEFGRFQLDSSILKVLPSATLLGLKKWPKSYQPTTTSQPLNQSKNSSFSNIEKLKPFKIDKTTGVGKSLYDYENTFENMAHTAIIKYKSLQTNCSKNSQPNSTQISKNKSYNIPKAPQSSDDSSNSNLNITNYESSSKGKFINISQLPNVSTELDNEPLSGVKHILNINNKFTKTESSFNLQHNYNWPSRELKVSAKPVKIKNIFNLKTSVTNSFSSNPLAASHVTKSKDDILNQKSDGKNIPESAPKVSNISTRSLLKPILKTQQISTLSLTNPDKNQTTLSAKPLITKIEILPPLKLLPPIPVQPNNSTLTNAPINLIKPPIDYKHQCSYCYKYFKQKSSLTKHIRTHTGEKPYKCNLCPKSYADASNYKKHKILHKNAAEALNITRTTTTATNAIQNSPAYSTVSDPDPDGIEVMQALRKFECSFTEDEEEEIEDDDASLSSSSTTMESQMWHNALDHALRNEELRKGIKRNLADINNAILP